METPAVIVAHLDCFDAGGPGTVMFSRDRQTLLVKCPGCGEASALPLNDSTSRRSPGWKLVSADPLTLSPSIHHDVAECGWHGYLKEGVWKT